MNDRKIHTLYKEYCVPEHIIKHMYRVADVAILLAKKIKDMKGAEPDLDTLKYGALLHDIVKVCEFNENSDLFQDPAYSKTDHEVWIRLIRNFGQLGHIDAAFEILEELGEPELANMIKKHKFHSIITNRNSDKLNTIEEKLLYYADKRVLHDRIVSLKERLDDGKKRYLFINEIRNKDDIGEEDESKTEAAIYQLEKELCRLAGIAPEDINESTVERGYY